MSDQIPFDEDELIGMSSTLRSFRLFSSLLNRMLTTNFNFSFDRPSEVFVGLSSLSDTSLFD